MDEVGEQHYQGLDKLGNSTLVALAYLAFLQLREFGQFGQSRYYLRHRMETKFLLPSHKCLSQIHIRVICSAFAARHGSARIVQRALNERYD